MADAPMNTRTQNARILKWLLAGKTLTPLQALEKFKVMRLASRIGDLKELGYEIKTEMIKLKSGKRVGRYQLINKDNE